jgi:hypothetical protein
MTILLSQQLNLIQQCYRQGNPRPIHIKITMYTHGFSGENEHLRTKLPVIGRGSNRLNNALLNNFKYVSSSTPVCTQTSVKLKYVVGVTLMRLHSIGTGIEGGPIPPIFAIAP